jgi:hypothetical protein
MADIIGRILVGIIESLFELFCQGTGRFILRFCGNRKPSTTAAFLVGLAVWIVIACALASYARSTQTI